MNGNVENTGWIDNLPAGACLSLDEIRRMTRDLMQAHARWIPQFNGRLPEEKKELWFSAADEPAE